jgi:hypothetical protein
MQEKLISFYLDESAVREELTQFLRSAGEAIAVSRENRQLRWNRELPSRVGEYYYDYDWLVLPQATNEISGINMSTFSADHFKTPEQVGKTLEALAASSEWAVFPWGGYARYGMLGLVAGQDAMSKIRSQPIFQYSTNVPLDRQYRGVLGRRSRTEFGPSLWKAIGAEYDPPTIITFEYYEDAFEGLKSSFKVEGTFAQREGQSPVSAYRILDFETFRYFAGNANQFGVFDVVPGCVDFQSCVRARQEVASQNFVGALRHTPWYLVYNGGEIDTNHALFVSTNHAATAHFVGESDDILDFVSFF